MPQIYIAALITTAASAGLWLFLGRSMAGPYRGLWWLTLTTLPLSAAVNLLVKRPLLQWVQESGYVEPGAAGPPFWFLLFALFLAPVTEEASKVLPVVLPVVRRQMARPGSWLWAGLFLGVGFGLGEIWYLAFQLAGLPILQGMPFWQMTGFLGERMMVTGAHGVMTAVLMLGVAAGRLRALGGYIAAVLLHALLNVGALLYQTRQISAEWAGLWGMLVFIPLFLLFGYLVSLGSRSEPPVQTVIYRRKPN